MIYMAEILSGTDGSEIRKILYDEGIFILCDIENKLVKLTSYLIIGNISKAW